MGDYNTSNYAEQGGGNLVIGGTLTVAAAGQIVVTTGGKVSGLLEFDGGATNPAVKFSGAGSSKGTTAGTAYTTGAPTFANAQLSLRVYIGSTAYRIPVWADA